MSNQRLIGLFIALLTIGLKKAAKAANTYRLISAALEMPINLIDSL